MDPKLKTYLDEHFDAVDERFNAVDKKFSSVDERFESIENRMATKDDLASLRSEMATKDDLKSLEDNITNQLTSMSQTFTTVLNRVENDIEELNEIVSDAGLGGRVHKLEIELKEIKTKVA